MKLALEIIRNQTQRNENKNVEDSNEMHFKKSLEEQI